MASGIAWDFSCPAAGIDWNHLYGYPSPYEVWNASGIGPKGETSLYGSAGNSSPRR